MKYLCTICSRKKSEEPGLLPASKRYLGLHIIETFSKARKLNLPVLILSGKYGLLSPETPIPYYDKLLDDSEIETLSELISIQFEEFNVTELVLFLEKNRSNNWDSYVRSLQIACNHKTVSLESDYL